MYILGINGGANSMHYAYVDELIHGQFHDSSVVLLKDGHLHFALEEERVTRIKHTNYFPLNALHECLLQNALSPADIDYYAFAITKSTLEAIGAKIIKDMVIPDPGLIVLKDIFKRHTGKNLDLKKVRLYDHHYCHAVSTFYQSGFESALVVTLDGMGDGLSGSVYTGRNGRLELLREFPVEKSLGHFYLEVTEYLGMQIFDEYKVMGLAPYGNAAVYKDIFSECYDLLPNGDFVIHFNKFHLLDSIGPARKKNEPIEQRHKDVAAALQSALETIVFHLINALLRETGMRRLCLAGGVALNCKLTGELLYANLFDDIFVFPAAGDNGLSTGAALACQLDVAKSVPNAPLRSVSLGAGFEEKEIEATLDDWQHFISYEKCNDIYETTAALLAQNEVIGWFSGREEYGPRALGNRSIVADPRPAENRDRINAIIKMREGFRPFAPAILEESVGEYFQLPNNGKKDYPFMSFILKAKEQYKKLLGAVVHTDGTARVQTVSKKYNEQFWKLINSFSEITGTPVLLNTSFNNNYEPIVHAPADAIAFLLTSDINYLVLNDFLIRKTEVVAGTGHVAIQTLDHLVVAAGPAADGLYYLHDVYTKKDIAISEAIWKVMATGSFVELADAALTKEIKDLWRKRLIKILPHAKIEAEIR